MKRKFYIDNLRSFVILMLFPFHTLRMYTSIDPFYVEGPHFPFANIFVRFCSIWFMNLLFILAGMSAYYSIKKRTTKTFFIERLKRLLIPFIFGTLLIVPAQTYVAEISKNHYTGSYLKQYLLFFFKKTDLSGYTGGFTPGHLWFLLFLFTITLLCFPVIIWVKQHNPNYTFFHSKFQSLKLILLFIPYSILGLWELGKPIGRYLFCFLIGFLIIRQEEVLDHLKKHVLFFSLLGFLTASLYTGLSLYKFNLPIAAPILNILSYLLFYFSSLCMIYAMLGIGQKFLNFQTKPCTYFRKNSFSIYYVHQSILVLVGYFMISHTDHILLQILGTIFFSFVLSVLSVEIIKKIPVIRFLFGMSK